ncbi:MAG: trypsin-like peptidase domain-containing protein, partial [Cyanobacteria bacterium]|nr:trypsin-like peptidase domain-containing protein [Cyanobacteriota bacterium]
VAYHHSSGNRLQSHRLFNTHQGNTPAKSLRFEGLVPEGETPKEISPSSAPKQQGIFKWVAGMGVIFSSLLGYSVYDNAQSKLALNQQIQELSTQVQQNQDAQARALNQAVKNPQLLKDIFQPVVQASQRNSMRVEWTTPDGDEAMGSGFAIQDKAGNVYVITNAHVLGSELLGKDVGTTVKDKTITIQDSLGNRTEGQFLSMSPIYAGDLAILKVPPTFAQALKAKNMVSELRDLSQDPIDANLKGTWMVTSGNPLGNFNFSSVGMVSTLMQSNANASLNPLKTKLSPLIQMDISMNPGNSGGALMDLNQKVAGVAQAINGKGSGIGYFIPVKTLKEFLESQNIPVASDQELAQKLVNVEEFKAKTAAIETEYQGFAKRVELLQVLMTEDFAKIPPNPFMQRPSSREIKESALMLEPYLLESLEKLKIDINALKDFSKDLTPEQKDAIKTTVLEKSFEKHLKSTPKPSKPSTPREEAPPMFRMPGGDILPPFPGGILSK